MKKSVVKRGPRIVQNSIFLNSFISYYLNKKSTESYISNSNNSGIDKP